MKSLNSINESIKKGLKGLGMLGFVLIAISTIFLIQFIFSMILLLVPSIVIWFILSFTSLNWGFLNIWVILSGILYFGWLISKEK